MRNPVARIKAVLGELLLNGRLAVQSGAAQAQRLDALEHRLESLNHGLGTLIAQGGRQGASAAQAPAESARAATDATLPERLMTGPVLARVLVLADLLRPQRVGGREKQRVGGPHDGGYVMLDDWAGLAGAISVGIGNDDAWDRAVLSRGVPVAQFDHTITAPPGTAQGLSWQPLGIGAADVNNIRCLRSLIALSALPAAGDLVLKLDVEAAEWAALATEASAPLDRFRQIVIEFHWFDRVFDPDWYETARRALAHVARSHAVVHVHANNWGGVALLGGVCFPRVLEVTYCRRDRGDFGPEEGMFPTPLDAPCDATRPDIFLGSFRFPAPTA